MKSLSLPAALTRYAQRKIGAPIPSDIWDKIAIPPHLVMNYRVIDDAGRELATGRDLAALQAQLGQAAQLTFAQVEPGIERDQVRAWDFGDLPEQISFARNGRTLTGYPALADMDDSVAIRLFDTRIAADSAMRAGVRRLLSIELKEQMKQLEKSLPGYTQVALQLRSVVAPDDLKQDWLTALTDRAFIAEDKLPRTQQAYESLKQRARTRLPAVREAAARLFGAISEEYQRLALKVTALPSPFNRVAADARAQLDSLVYKGLFSATPWEQLAHLPRYLKAIAVRLDKYPNNPERDAKHAAEIAALWKLYLDRADKLRKAGAAEPPLDDFRWQIEELRVSLFAQELKTPYPVSIKRLKKVWDVIAR